MAFVLIFDANEAHALRASDALSAAGHACGWVTEMEQATRVLHRRVPDLILLDQAVPGADGGNLPAWLRRIAGVEHLPVILLTSGAFSAPIGTEFDCVTDEIRKPFDPGFLVWRVKHALECHAGGRGTLAALPAGSGPEQRLRLHA